MDAARAADVTDPEILNAVRFYRESPRRHSGSTNRLIFTSLAGIFGFDALHLVPEMLRRPLQVILGERRGSNGQFETGWELSERCTSLDKNFFVVDGAGHYDLYRKHPHVDLAVERLAASFRAHLGS
ncbi:alpha/beta hydrolase family protein [Muricoccus pecuniae]|uniref:Fermentation-respiration switch protein FrsA (DUF1100 family) n=1 Tax=Muricoccus pecuniae TaxID=693023 RepID=A0A840YGH2_9PROT|nr:alpha/beta hydrolase [Roseomonas pecuniae]MBB5695497.1 fermentation-respiration switch protein FrsA (DUF1100 family) [Roseomonas pecuniae]